MISVDLDFDDFVRVVTDLDYDQILTKTQDEIRAVDSLTAGHAKGGPAARKSGAPEYANLLRGLRFILTDGLCPSSVHDWDLVRMRPIVEGLVQRKRLRPEALSIF